MREAEEEEAAEQRAKLASTTESTGKTAAPQITQMSDEELMAEMRRRAEAKQT